MICICQSLRDPRCSFC